LSILLLSYEGICIRFVVSSWYECSSSVELVGMSTSDDSPCHVLFNLKFPCAFKLVVVLGSAQSLFDPLLVSPHSRGLTSSSLKILSPPLRGRRSLYRPAQRSVGFRTRTSCQARSELAGGIPECFQNRPSICYFAPPVGSSHSLPFILLSPVGMPS
jgi:hypothetical protein